jgi:hypothetical protein
VSARTLSIASESRVDAIASNNAFLNCLTALSELNLVAPPDVASLAREPILILDEFEGKKTEVIATVNQVKSLTKAMRIDLGESAGSHVKLEQLAMFLNPTYNSSFASNPLPETIRLSPGGSETGDLVYMIATFEWQKLAAPGQVRLVIEDLISGKNMEKVFEGDTWPKFTTKDMSPAESGIRMLQQNQDNGAHNSPVGDAAATITEASSSDPVGSQSSS